MDHAGRLAVDHAVRAALLSVVLLLACAVTARAACPSYAPTSSVISWISIKACGAIGDGSADDTAAIQAAIDYAFAHNLSAVYCPAGVYKVSSTIYLDPPGNLRTSWSTPTMFQFAMAFFGDPKSSGAQPLTATPSCQISATFDDGVALVVGPGQGMRVSDIAVRGPNSAYRCNLSPDGVGIGIAGGNGGASDTLIQNTFVRYFFALYKTSVNGGVLSDSNSFDHVGGFDGCYGIYLSGTQSFINNINTPYFGNVTYALLNSYGHQTQVIGGNLSTNTNQSHAFTISSVVAANCGGYTFCLTAVVASPDAYIPNVYDSFEILTTHFGLIPFKMTAWDAGASTISLTALETWLDTNYGHNGYWFNNDIYDEVNAATTLYASERIRAIQGVGVELDGTHIENDQSCTTFYDSATVWGGQNSSELRNVFFNYNISLPEGATLANKYCQQAFPFIDLNQGSLRLSGGDWSPGAGTTNYPLNFDTVIGSDIRGVQLNATALFNFRFNDTGGATSRAYSQIDVTDNVLSTVARGAGVWDQDYFSPHSWYNQSELTVPFCGYEPCPSATPNLSPTLYALVSGSLGALGTYPAIACRTVFKSLDWNTTSPAGGKLWLRSASCPGWSYGQNLTDATVGGTVTWSYKRGSSDLYLDSGTMGWMAPGLGISIDNGEGDQPYTVTGVYPYLGYVTVIWAGANGGNAGGNSVGLQGATDQVYSCASSCTIGQEAYSWTAY